ncbi:MAG TPA: SGNH/GDSL hydrolase family protein [Vicinamibacteria bacterium]
MTHPRPGGRFERHPRLTGAGLVVLALLVLELGLRSAAPGSLRFAQGMRRVHRYSRVARVDLRPSQSAALRIDREDGQPLFDFRLSTGAEGFRIEETAAPPPPGARFVHAIGDSYTMGWGVEAADSYPARLARRLAPELAVLNLGVDGFGAIGAVAKSRALAERYPPVHAVYLFSPNDLEDDRRAEAVTRRSSLVHTANEALDAVRRSSFLAGVPFALRYRLQFRAGPAAPTGGTGRVPTESLLLPEPAAPSAPLGDYPTFTALGAYRDFLAVRGARLLVLVLSTQPESLAAYRFCREQGIEARLFDVPPALRIPDEGHFNAAGNEAVAALVAGLLRAGPNGAGR